MPIQAEFDWYNLDAEYSKLLPQDILKNVPNGNTNKCMSNEQEVIGNNIGVEYNLDAEFALTTSSVPLEVIADDNSFVESCKSNASDVNVLPTLARDDGYNGMTATLSPTKKHYLRNRKNINSNKANNNKSFDSFLEDTGLTAKPLPQKRKIFYTPPFV